mmetsp:Transcript_46141/g.142742  ORF Transcript_46141/g.142742 Transcript_46141/m.142742 type:complete len:227 (+) Transcript_46141:123-803(+)
MRGGLVVAVVLAADGHARPRRPSLRGRHQVLALGARPGVRVPGRRVPPEPLAAERQDDRGVLDPDDLLPLHGLRRPVGAQGLAGGEGRWAPDRLQRQVHRVDLLRAHRLLNLRAAGASARRHAPQRHHPLGPPHGLVLHHLLAGAGREELLGVGPVHHLGLPRLLCRLGRAVLLCLAPHGQGAHGALARRLAHLPHRHGRHLRRGLPSPDTRLDLRGDGEQVLLHL